MAEGKEHPVKFDEEIAYTETSKDIPPVDGLVQPAPGRLHRLHGTTTLGFVFQHGVLIAVDSRSTMGQYISSQTVKKVIEITPRLLGTMAGGAADCDYWERRLARRVRLRELESKEEVTVAAASRMLANMLYYYKGMGLSVGTMVAGFDASGPHLYYVDNDGVRYHNDRFSVGSGSTVGTMVAGFDASGPHLYYVDNDGVRYHNDRFSVGSGSTYAYAILDQEYRYDLSVEEAVTLGRRAIYHATHRDAMSGGFINVYLMTEDGWQRYPTKDCYVEHYGEEEPFLE
ncbi:Proteasome subunit beta type-5 [Aduncisulcus paluster]|uniref:Proteasome subunit beta n=1 Tax=Aduncisulcus paluster TaxID=2918883 RepID=A0ABQ5K8H7_9EUKA|nr:Proteasome subunit beta type-5 [Aduncisulcus paluster]